ncbi:Cyclin-B1-1 [Mortierella sp. NVP85]|nr:Cyclin-B1-1 [Mortierella sp. NVP85]
MSESSIPQISISEIGKRKATDSLTPRPRAMTLSQERPPSSMLTVPGEVSQSRDSPGHHQNQCTPNTHLHSLTSPPSNQSGFWTEDPDNPDPNNTKRPKPDLRGTKGRQARRVDWTSSRRPTLNKHSTGSMIAGMSLCDDNGQENILQGSQDVDPCNSDDAGTMMDGCEQTPITDEIPGPRRLPLRDISARVAVTDDALDSTKANRHSQPTLRIGKGVELAAHNNIVSLVLTSSLSTSLSPLLATLPASIPQRLVITTPFPANPGYWKEYANDTLKYLFEIEKRYDRFMYLNAQSEYPVCREAVVQLLTELCYSAKPKFTPAILHHAVNLLDRYLSIHNIEFLSFNQLQCVGIGSFMIAAKLEEGVSSGINLSVLSNAYGIFTREELAKTEKAILSGLKFEILVASARGFSDYFKHAVLGHPQMIQLVDFLCDISLFSHKFLDFETSQIAASALWIALCAIRQDWNEDLGVLTGYRRTDLTHCSVIFRELIFSVGNTLDLSRSLGSNYTLEHILPVLLDILR